MTMLAHRLVRLIEKHADELANTLESRIVESKRCSNYDRVANEELRTLVGGIYSHLGQWLITKTEEDLEQRYTKIGMRRAEQNVPVSQLLWCIVLVKENLWMFLRQHEDLDSTAQIFGELELAQMIDQFFDRAMYFAVRGHERVRDSLSTEIET